MSWSLARLRPLHLVLVTVVYWLGLAAVKLGSAIVSAWWVSRLSPNHGSITASLQNTTLHLTIVENGTPLWSGSTPLVQLGLFMLGPPLLLWLTARWSRDVENAGPMGAIPSRPPDAALPPPHVQWPDEIPADPERTRVADPRANPADRRS
jgi:hypothetical protein